MSGVKEPRLFMGLAEEHLRHVLAACTQQTLLPGDFIFREGDDGDVLFLVESGSVEVYTTIRPDLDRVLLTAGPGEVFGELSWIDGTRRSAGARTVAATHVYALTRAAFDHLATENPAVAAGTYAALTTVLAERLRHTNEAYKDSVDAYLEVAGLGSLNLNRLAEDLRPVTVHLIGGATVRGRLLDLENQPPGWALFVKEPNEKISLIPYQAITRIEVT